MVSSSQRQKETVHCFLIQNIMPVLGFQLGSIWNFFKIQAVGYNCEKCFYCCFVHLVFNQTILMCRTTFNPDLLRWEDALLTWSHLLLAAYIKDMEKDASSLCWFSLPFSGKVILSLASELTSLVLWHILKASCLGN